MPPRPARPGFRTGSDDPWCHLTEIRALGINDEALAPRFYGADETHMQRPADESLAGFSSRGDTLWRKRS
jgi:hypothetical protein